ncbi:MAG TPA: hypothetical protein VK704_06625, partial [Acidimicrobiales bacterium]|nr:hypothetical protein [Acidimicrobiales bacterium]
MAITGTNFINDGGTDALTATGSGVTFTSVAVTSSTSATADYSVTGAAVAGPYTAIISFDADATTASLADAVTVSSAVTVTSAAPSPIYENTGANTITISGSNFETGATIAFTSDVDGTTITSSVTSVSADGSTIVASVTPTNTKTSGAATVGTYDVTVSNPDGGSATLTAGFAVTNGIQEISPSSYAGSISTSTDTVVLTGSDLEPGATVTITGCAQITGAVTLVSASGNSATVSFPELGTAAQACTVHYANPAVGGDGLTYLSAVGALSIGEASSVAPIVTGATAPTTPVNVGTSGTPVTLTGFGFGYYTQLQSTATGITFNAATPSTTGTTITAPVNVASSTVNAGPTDVEAANGAHVSTPFATAFTVAGPSITSTAPAAIAVGAAYGTTIAVTGTGFTPTTTGSIGDGGALAGIVSYVSPTAMTVTITHGSSAAGTATISLQESTATGTVNTSFTLPVDAAPTVSSVAYPTGITDVGVGATAATVYINGTGFATGVTVTKFVNAAGTADPNVTATVTKVTATQLTVTVAVTAPDANPTVGYTVTNTDGGSVPVLATQVGA